jgi:hypothetical protein
MINFSFNQKTQRYHYLDGDKKGQFVSQSKVRELVQGYLTDYQQEFESSTRLMIDGGISLKEWEQNIAKHMKNVTIVVHKIAKPDATPSDYGKIGAYLKTQYLYLRKFTQDIAKGNLSEAQINARAAQYLQSTWSLFNTTARDAHKQSGYKWERRLQQSKHPCIPCIKYSKIGWSILGTLPKIGEQCDCKQNCRCYFEFSQSNGKPQESLSLRLEELIKVRY